MGGLAAILLTSLCLTGDPSTVPTQTVVASQEPLPPLIATRQMMFLIPFAVGVDDAAAGHTACAADTHIELWRSQDRGQTWRLCDAVSSCCGGFLFRAAGDGELWFVARKADADAGQPQRGTTPQLRVLVDTQPPVLSLEAWRGEAGQICATWRIDDSCVDQQSVKIFFRAGRRSNVERLPWHELAIDRRVRRSDTKGGSDAVNRPTDINWCVDADADYVEVRARVVDRAGNTAVSHAYVDLSTNHSDVRSGKLGKLERSAPAAPVHFAP